MTLRSHAVVAWAALLRSSRRGGKEKKAWVHTCAEDLSLLLTYLFLYSILQLTSHDKDSDTMANNHEHSPWRKSMLIPFWCIQIFFMLAFIALLGLAFGILATYDNNNEDWDNTQFNNVNDPEQVFHVAKDAIVPVWITLCVICLVLTITEIILLARHKLRPLAFLITNVIKASIWTALFILDIISAVTEGGRTTSAVGIIIDTILLYVSPCSLFPTAH